MHDTIELLSADLGELREIYRKEVAPRVHANRAAGTQQSSGQIVWKGERYDSRGGAHGGKKKTEYRGAGGDLTRGPERDFHVTIRTILGRRSILQRKKRCLRQLKT
jgi:hypothetical protein